MDLIKTCSLEDTQEHKVNLWCSRSVIPLNLHWSLKKEDFIPTCSNWRINKRVAIWRDKMRSHSWRHRDCLRRNFQRSGDFLQEHRRSSLPVKSSTAPWEWLLSYRMESRFQKNLWSSKWMCHTPNSKIRQCNSLRTNLCSSRSPRCQVTQWEVWQTVCQT